MVREGDRPWSGPPTPFQRIAERARRAGLDPRAFPRRWEKIGDVLVLKLPPSLDVPREALAALYATVLDAKTVVEYVGGVQGPWRLPNVRWLWGGGTETVHLEDGVRFALDVAKVMFSSGNLPERIRMGRHPGTGEVVVDLFAGIGYFSLPMAVHSKAARIVACEANPVAFRYLEDNVRINRVTSIEPRLGDCRDVAPTGIADRVVMGHFDAYDFLDVAFRAAKGRATIHLHGLVGPRHPASEFERRFEEDARRNGFETVSRALRRVKSHGRKVWHVVLDMDVRRS